MAMNEPMLSRRHFVAAILAVPALPSAVAGASAAESRVVWWRLPFLFAQVPSSASFSGTGARVAIFNHAADPSWGPCAQLHSTLDTLAEAARLRAMGARIITYIEGFGDAANYAAAFAREADGRLRGRAEDPQLPAALRTHWCWGDPKLPHGDVLGWLGLPAVIEGEDYSRREGELPRWGLPIPTYPDGRPARGRVVGVEGPAGAALFDACGAMDLNGRLDPGYGPAVGVVEALAAGRGAQVTAGLVPAVVGRDAVEAPTGSKPGDVVWCGNVYVGKDLSAPFWIEAARVSIREIARRGVDGVWCDNTSPWDNFGYPPVHRAFGRWSVAGFQARVKARAALPDAPEWTQAAGGFDVVAAMRATASRLGARDPRNLSDPVWRDARWLDEPMWGAFRAYRQQSALAALRAFSKAVHQEAEKAGKPDFCLGGNDIPLYGLGWIRDDALDMVNTEVSPGWHMGTGSRGIGLPPVGRMSAVYRLAREHQRGPFVGAWYYLDGDVAKHRKCAPLAKALISEAFAHGACLLCDPAQDRVAGSPETHAWFNRFVRANEDAFIGRTPMADIGLVFSPDSQLALLAPGGFPDMDRQPHMFGHLGWAHVLLAAGIPYRAVPEWRLTAEGLAGLRTLIMPDVDCVSDSAAAAVRTWARAGGRLILSGPAGARTGPDADFSRRAAPALTGSGAGKRSGIVELEPMLGMRAYLRGADAPAAVATMRMALPKTGLMDAAALPDHVSAALWRRGESTLCVDLANLAFDAESGEVKPHGALRVRVRMPAGWSGVRATALSPDSPVQAEATEGQGWVDLRVDRLDYYATVQLTPVRASGKA